MPALSALGWNPRDDTSLSFCVGLPKRASDLASFFAVYLLTRDLSVVGLCDGGMLTLIAATQLMLRGSLLVLFHCFNQIRRWPCYHIKRLKIGPTPCNI